MGREGLRDGEEGGMEGYEVGGWRDGYGGDGGMGRGGGGEEAEI